MNRDELLVYAQRLGIENADKLSDDDLATKVKVELDSMIDTVGDLRAATKVAAEEVEFAKKYPDQAERLRKLEEKDQKHEATSFANSVADFAITAEAEDGTEAEVTKFRLSVAAQEIVKSTHLKLAQGNLVPDDLKQLIETVATGGVQQGEIGSSRTNPNADYEGEDEDVAPLNRVEARKAFADKVSEIMKKDNLDQKAAMQEAGRRYPKLAAAYATL